MAAEPPPIISVRNLTKYYGGTLGIQNLNFAVKPGETSTIRMLLDLLRPSSGEIKMLGHEIYAHSLEIRKICLGC